MDKDSFISALMSMSKEDLVKYVKEKGKEPKMIKPYLILPDKAIISNED